MKCLTVSQPWASLIAGGDKYIENRSWSSNYRGPLAIHAGLGSQYLSKDELAKYRTGEIIAVGELADCVALVYVRSLALNFGDSCRVGETGRTAGEIVADRYCEGPWLWILKDVRAVEPVKIKGKQGLWNFDGEVKYIQ